MSRVNFLKALPILLVQPEETLAMPVQIINTFLRQSPGRKALVVMAFVGDLFTARQLSRQRY